MDAITIAGQVITALQSITSRNVSPLDSVVLTIGTISGGIRGNIIPDEVKMTAILRTINPETRKLVKQRIINIVENVCSAFGGVGEVVIEAGYEALINTDMVVDVIIDTAIDVFGNDKLILREKPSLGVEDFSYFINAAKGAFYHLGCRNEDKNITSPLHTAGFDIDEDCLPIGVIMNTSIVANLLNL